MMNIRLLLCIWISILNFLAHNVFFRLNLVLVSLLVLLCCLLPLIFAGFVVFYVWLEVWVVVYGNIIRERVQIRLKCIIRTIINHTTVILGIWSYVHFFRSLLISTSNTLILLLTLVCLSIFVQPVLIVVPYIPRPAILLHATITMHDIVRSLHVVVGWHRASPSRMLW